MKKLTQLRKRINAIDGRIVRLIARRQSYMPAIARAKRALRIPYRQPRRERAIISSKRQLAKKLGVSPILIERLFKLIFADSREIQAKKL